MYDATVSHVFSISLIAPEDCCFVVTSPSSDKLSSKLLAVNHNQLHKLFSGQLLVMLFHKFIDIISIQLQSLDLGQRYNFVDSDSSMSHSTTLSDQSFFRAEVRVFLVIPRHAFSIILRQETIWNLYF
ncbi:hypothetical protein AVEN_38687-1 [Araneus ventricosus]|uniref:Uncharacterized protein n=1 Tax=Araneus ventricosus TaxID=182803 RepID=A0A4Y2LT85_ARAVE|nr:hypothetical protein AVEN_189258-1 [Araneus ventricosus]GBN17964.1 hypothetical protein AVEN_38687-1 [Araneus ventricosus]